jgi:hypothetical protein
MTIALERFYASVGEDHEIIGRTYLRISEIGTFNSDTPYPIVQDSINSALKEEALRDQRTLKLIEQRGERRSQIQR